MKQFVYPLLATMLSSTVVYAADSLPAPVQAIAKQGITIVKSFPAPNGMTGYLGKYQDMGVTIYLMPDGKHAISGYMYDEKGNNLSEEVIQKDIYAPAGREMWKQLEKAHWIADGKESAPRKIYVFSDPYCPYCKAFWKKARPWVDSGKVQIRTLLVGVIRPESSATAATILASGDPAKAWHDYESAQGKPDLKGGTKPGAEQVRILQANQGLMDNLGAQGTPAIYYMSPNNELQQAMGMPDEAKLKAIMGE
ncbi:thiol:disulfide interchange protein DsbG [Salmonella enterica subsp. enterica serovar Choleraesuis]|nr:thiol:disulfide interchange protein DsbG [Salmonella enterica subsp. enterica serovar Choleraesuis]